MNLQEYLLTCLGEECAEVIQITSKINRFGLEDADPSGNTEINELLLQQELIDVMAVVEMLREYGIIRHLPNAVQEERIEKKKAKLVKYMHYSEARGILEIEKYKQESPDD